MLSWILFRSNFISYFLKILFACLQSTLNYCTNPCILLAAFVIVYNTIMAGCLGTFETSYFTVIVLQVAKSC